MLEHFESIVSTDVMTFTEKIENMHNAKEVQKVVEKNTLTLLQWRLKNLIEKHTENNPSLSDSATIRWILSDVDMLELLLNSGYVSDHRWVNAIHVLEQILDADSTAKTSSYHKRLAVAVALTFSTPVLSFASYKSSAIDPLKRYLSFAKCVEEEKFFPVHNTLSTWLLRYVVASWAENEELDWARKNILPKFKCPSLVGEATHSMIRYRDCNDKGVSIHDGASYYDNKPCTLEILKEYGAVCGGVSKFGASMAQAFGIPACPVGQPGHCAFLWWKEGDWVMSNACSGITESNTHAGIQWSWNERCDYQLLFDKAQKDFEKYSLSEQLRWASTIVNDPVVKVKIIFLAIETCPENYLLWRDVARFVSETLPLLIKKDKTVKNRVDLWYKDASKTFNENANVNVISAFCKVTSSVEEKMENLIDRSDSEWYCMDKEAWIELEFPKLITVSSIEIQWWGISFARKYSIQVAGEDYQYMEEKTEKDAYEKPEDYNTWSRLTGWSKPTKKIKFKLSEGQLDHWDMNVWIGIRQVNVHGKYCNADNENDDLTKYLERTIRANFVDFPLIGQDLLKQLEPQGLILSTSCSISSSVQHRIRNLIDGTDSEWYCKEQEAWIELDFGKLCTIYSVTIQWWGISFAKEYTVLAAGEDGHYNAVKSEKDAYEGPKSDCDYNEWSKLTGWSVSTRKIKLVLRNGCLDPWGNQVWIGARQIVVKGMECS